MKKYLYKGQIVTASSKEEAKVIAKSTEVIDQSKLFNYFEKKGFKYKRDYGYYVLNKNVILNSHYDNFSIEVFSEDYNRSLTLVDFGEPDDISYLTQKELDAALSDFYKYIMIWLDNNITKLKSLGKLNIIDAIKQAKTIEKITEKSFYKFAKKHSKSENIFKSLNKIKSYVKQCEHSAYYEDKAAFKKCIDSLAKELSSLKTSIK